MSVSSDLDWVKLFGSAPAESVLFRSASVNDQLSGVSSAWVEVECAQAHLNPDDWLGFTLGLSFNTANNHERTFQGVVTSFGLISQASAVMCRYRIGLHTWPWLLGRNRDYRVFQNLSVPEIVTRVIRGLAHPAVRLENQTRSRHPSWEYCVQYGESDLNFICRLMEQEGISWFIDHRGSDQVMVLLDDPNQFKTEPGHEALRFDPTAADSRFAQKASIHQLTACKSLEPSGFVHADYNPLQPMQTLRANATGAQLPSGVNSAWYEYPGEFEQLEDGRDLAEIRKNEIDTRREWFVGESLDRGLKAGRLLQIESIDSPWLDGHFLLTEVNLQMAAAANNQGEHGGHFSCHFRAIASDTVYRPPRRAMKPFIKGVLSARVTGPVGEEIHTDELGRIKVQFFWDREGKFDDQSSCWVRMATCSAGRGWGFVSIPRIGQEVLVAFEDGDPDRPIAIGLAFNADQTVPYDLPGNKTVSGWRSCSTQGGNPDEFNELRFEDLRGAEYVRLQAQRDMYTKVKQHDFHEVGQDVHRSIGGNVYEEIAKDRYLTVLGDMRAKVNSGHIKTDDDLIAEIGGLLSVNAQGGLALSANGRVSMQAQGVHVQAASDGRINASESIHMRAGRSVVLSASDAIVLTVGGSSITITDGSIVLSSPSIGNAKGGGGIQANSAVGNPAETAQLPEAPDIPTDPLS